jgi:hypothetical protein
VPDDAADHETEGTSVDFMAEAKPPRGGRAGSRGSGEGHDEGDGYEDDGYEDDGYEGDGYEDDDGYVFRAPFWAAKYNAIAAMAV